MAQYAVPQGDITDGNWLNQAGSATNMYQSIAPDTPGSIGAGDDTDYVESPLAPVNEACAFDLSTVEDPQSSSGHIMRWRRGKNAAGGAAIDLTVQLRQGYTGEGAQGTLIRSVSDAGIPDAFTTTTATLSGAEADSITNYADLQLRLVANQP